MASRKKLIICFFALFGLVLFASVIQAAYTTPQKISISANNALSPQLAPDVDGYLHLVWMEVDDMWSWPNPGIFYSRWNGDIWSSPEKISNNTGFSFLPAVTAGPDKIVHTVYSDNSALGGVNFRILYTERLTDGSWTTPIILPHPTFSFVQALIPKIAVDANNNLHVIYGVKDNSGWSLFYTSCSGGSDCLVAANWSGPERVGFETDGVTPTLNSRWGEIYGDKLGDVHLIYSDELKGTFYRKLEGGNWSEPLVVIAANDIAFPKLTVDDDGNPFIIWFSPGDKGVWARRTEEGVWQTPDQLSTNGATSLSDLPIIGITTNSKNIIAAGWAQQGSAPGKLDVVYRYYSGGSWSNPDQVRVDRPWPDTPFLIRDKWDNQHLVWSETASTTNYKTDIWYSVFQGTQMTVNTTGGTVTVNPNNITLATLDFPNGALSQSTEITALIGPLPETVDPSAVTVPRAFTFGPSGTTFPAGKNPTITFNYTDEELEGGDPNSLEAFVWDSQTATYSARSGTVNTKKKTLTVETIDHFSLFAMAARRVLTSFLDPFVEGMTVQQNSVLPLKFQVKYADGNLAPKGEIVVQVKQGETLLEEFTSLEGGLRYQQDGDFYKVNLSTKELEGGNYQIIIFRDGPTIAQTSFSVGE